MHGKILGTLVVALLAAPASAGAVTVYAATSLTEVMPAIAPDPRYSFGASNALQLQIERGAPADLYLAAAPEEAHALYRAGRCERPRTFATNELVVAVREGDPDDVRSIGRLVPGGRRLSVGNAQVPIGDYTRQLLDRLGMSSMLRTNRVSEQANVGQVLSQVAFGGADAGFVYASDAQSRRRRLDALAVPAWAQPPVRYLGCVVRRDGADRAGAQALLDGLRAARAREVLARYGFGLPPQG